MSRRDIAAERRYLTGCCSRAGTTSTYDAATGNLVDAAGRTLEPDAHDYVLAVQARLDMHGPDAAPRTAAEILQECLEEIEDQAGYCVLAVTAVPPGERDELLRRVAPVVAAARDAWDVVRRAQRAMGTT